VALADDVRNQIIERLEELRPLLEERQRLEEMLAAMDRVDGARGGEAGKRQPLEARKGQVAAVIKESPGIRVKDIAPRLGLSVPRVVQIVNALADDGAVLRRDDHGLIFNEDHAT
jgi:DNA-binding MarR family transcriptional regulator